MCAGKWMYTHTTRNYEDDQWVETRTNVSRQIYEQLLVQVKQNILAPQSLTNLMQANRQNNVTIRKTRRCFKWNDQYYQMDIYRSPHPGLMLLETWSSLPPEQLQMPDFLTVKENVTGNPQYSMFNLSKQS